MLSCFGRAVATHLEDALSHDWNSLYLKQHVYSFVKIKFFTCSLFANCLWGNKKNSHASLKTLKTTYTVSVMMHGGIPPLQIENMQIKEKIHKYIFRFLRKLDIHSIKRLYANKSKLLSLISESLAVFSKLVKNI